MINVSDDNPVEVVPLETRNTGPGHSLEPLHPTKKTDRRRRRKPPWTIDQFQVPKKEGHTRFHDIGLPDEIMHAVADLDFKYCTPIQARTLAHLHQGRDIAGRAQTGTGKTAAFLISIFDRFLKNPLHGERPKGTPRALVLAPTRELVIQIADDAQKLSKYCAFNNIAIYGGMDNAKQKVRLRSRPVDLMVATPGRLLDFMQQRLIDLTRIDTLVIDEADRMLDMGFIPDVRRIIRKTSPRNTRRTMLFSATLTRDVLHLASQWMQEPVICEVEPEQVTVKTTEQIVYVITTRQKFQLLYNLLRQRPGQRILIFCNRRDQAQSLASKLKKHGIQCELLSGAIPQKKRLQILRDFREGTMKIVVATDVAGRGLHVQDISVVVNYQFPYDPEDYVHRIGRTGRAGMAGTAISFACEDESYVIPDIETYIGHDLPCIIPDSDLLALPKRP